MIDPHYIYERRTRHEPTSEMGRSFLYTVGTGVIMVGLAALGLWLFMWVITYFMHSWGVM